MCGDVLVLDGRVEVIRRRVRIRGGAFLVAVEGVVVARQCVCDRLDEEIAEMVVGRIVLDLNTEAY